MRAIPVEQVVERIRVENPWWEPPARINEFYSSLKPRAYFDLLYPLVRQRSVRRAVLLMGPRRVGKTVLLHHVVQRLIEDGVPPKQLCYISVDHPLYNGCSLAGFLKRYTEAVGEKDIPDGSYFFFDEIQYLREWEVHLKALVDTYPSLKFIASGSAAAALRLKSQESGAGRFTDFLLPPLTFHEYLDLVGKGDLVFPSDERPGFDTRDIEALNSAFLDYLNYGGYPELALSPAIQADPGRFIKSDIIDKVLLRDLPSLYGIQDIQELNYLFTTLAFNTANEVSLEELSKNSGLAKNTIKKYIEYLEAAFLVKVVHRIDRSAKRFQRANFFKVYLTNASIRSSLFAPLKPTDDSVGHVAETAIYSQWFHSPYQLYYARWSQGEVDIVCLGPNQKPSWAVEVKYSDRFFEHPLELRSLLTFAREHSLERAIVTTRTKKGKREVEGCLLEFLPASLYCYAIGCNVIRSKRDSVKKSPVPMTSGRSPANEPSP